MCIEIKMVRFWIDSNSDSLCPILSAFPYQVQSESIKTYLRVVYHGLRSEMALFRTESRSGSLCPILSGFSRQQTSEAIKSYLSEKQYELRSKMF